MAILRRSSKGRADKHRQEVVTGDFELHYEDVVNRNRYALIALFTSGLVLLAVFVPGAVYYSSAGVDRVSVEAEKGLLINPNLVTVVNGDPSASDGSYLEFRLKP